MTEQPPIRRLDPNVAEQIAAGEVIERPASVVKELVENAIDAGASRVHVAIVRGGRERIEVRDDGHGIAADQLALAFERHATSKLRAFEELSRLGTLGFRGEGLAAIAAVAHVQAASATEDGAGHRVVVDAGTIGPPADIDRARGTTIEVANLFGQLPARLKFLKSPATELAHVREMLGRIALAVPDVQIQLEHDGHPVNTWPKVRTRAERVAQMLGRPIVCQAHSDGPVSVSVYLADFADGARTAKHLSVLVNRRVVRDRKLRQVIVSALGDRLAPGGYPRGAVYLDIDGEDVDVNVHPQKLEVRFRDASEILTRVHNTVHAALEHAPDSNPARRYAIAEPRAARDEGAAARKIWGAAEPVNRDYGLAAALSSLDQAPTSSELTGIVRWGEHALLFEQQSMLVVGRRRDLWSALVRVMRERGDGSSVALSDSIRFAARHASELETWRCTTEPFGDGQVVLRSTPDGMSRLAWDAIARRLAIDPTIGLSQAIPDAHDHREHDALLVSLAEQMALSSQLARAPTSDGALAIALRSDDD